RREVFTHYFSEENRYSIDEVVDYVTQIVATLMGIDKSVSEEYAKKSLEFKNEMPYGHIRFLK
ncbi:MAG TPA: hypothetical protein DHN33_09745, partial [Eubacteriaceae bacterium]|nr:hypothetical protein [Eubacteriaceae bacterium]